MNEVSKVQQPRYLEWTLLQVHAEWIKVRRTLLVVTFATIALVVAGQLLAYRNVADLILAFRGMDGAGFDPPGSPGFVGTVVGQAPREFQALTAAHGQDSAVAFLAGSFLGALLLCLAGASFSGSEWDRRMSLPAFAFNPIRVLAVKLACAVLSGICITLVAMLSGIIVNAYITGRVENILPGFSDLAATSKWPSLEVVFLTSILCAAPAAIGFFGGLILRRTASGALIGVGLYVLDATATGFLNLIPPGILPFSALSSTIRATAPQIQDAGTFALMTTVADDGSLPPGLSLIAALVILGSFGWLNFKQGA
ncbi:hypothetical protein [Promicromonospora sp. NPDC090134]|uniref:hypothetical protein n=1 Tax=Promicromonospora sp. NPDC090134 TaxID=3364408 RepID=UPI00380F0164